MVRWIFSRYGSVGCPGGVRHCSLGSYCGRFLRPRTVARVRVFPHKPVRLSQVISDDQSLLFCYYSPLDSLRYYVSLWLSGVCPLPDGASIVVSEDSQLVSCIGTTVDDLLWRETLTRSTTPLSANQTNPSRLAVPQISRVIPTPSPPERRSITVCGLFRPAGVLPE